MPDQLTKPAPIVPIAEQKHRSKGEKLFDWAVYGGIAGVGTLIATAHLTYLMNYGSAKWFHEGVTKGFEKIAKLLPIKKNNGFSEQASLTTSLMMGGNLMVIPVGIIEHYKVPIVEKLNKLAGDNTPPEAVEEAPKQTWGSLLKARITAWVVVFTSMFGASKLFGNTMGMFKQEFAELACKIKGVPADKVGKTYRYGEILALDVFATAAAATLLYVGGHVFARRQEEKQQQKTHHTDRAVLADEALPAAEATSKPELRIAEAREHEGTLAQALVAQQR